MIIFPFAMNLIIVGPYFVFKLVNTKYTESDLKLIKEDFIPVS